MFTLHLEVKGHGLCVILVGDEGSVQAPLLCPHPDQCEDGDIPGEEHGQRCSLQMFTPSSWKTSSASQLKTLLVLITFSHA